MPVPEQTTCNFRVSFPAAEDDDVALSPLLTSLFGPVALPLELPLALPLKPPLQLPATTCDSCVLVGAVPRLPAFGGEGERPCVGLNFPPPPPPPPLAPLPLYGGDNVGPKSLFVLRATYGGKAGELRGAG